ncbi:MAG TPA: PQQ-binding-like beta-propeller repeat protein, partial [Gammaproteobacteria bacterium]|nr:PQQ-binding-like beta-propeller repeat protein [Gammaproteobacteria bacterium]
VNHKAVFITDDESRIWALDRQTGDTLWRQPDLRNRELTAPTPYKNMIVVGDFEGYVHILRMDTGQIIGRTQIDSKPIHTPVLAWDDSLFVLSSSGKLARFILVPVS